LRSEVESLLRYEPRAGVFLQNAAAGGFPSGRPEHKISVHGGKIPRWRSDRELFFLALDGTMMSVRVDPARNPPFAIPQPLFQTGLATIPVWNRPYEVALNGQRFLIPVSREASVSRSITSDELDGGAAGLTRVPGRVH